MNAVGNLAVEARYGEGRLSGISVCLERPPVAKLFVGLAPETVAKTVPRLYTLCAQAQGLACRAALAAAAGEGAPPVEGGAVLWEEALHEHFWRLLLDWPLAFGLPQAREAFIAWRGARGKESLSAATASLLESVLLGCPAGEWQENGRRPGPGALAEACLARLENIDITQNFASPPLTAAPWLAYWRGEREGAPDLPSPPSIAAAWRQRLEEAVAAARALEQGLSYPVAAAGAEGWGVGLTQTARGVLVHGIRLESGRVAAYRVWAPTDRLFAGPAPLAGLLNNGRWPGMEEARRAVEQAVLALDPCLPYTVKVENA